MKCPRTVTFLRVKQPDKALVTFLYKNFSFSENSMLSDFAKLYCKSRTPSILDFQIVVALYRNEIVGWGMATENMARRRRCYNYNDIMTPTDTLIMLYVKRNYRKHGIAGQIFSNLTKLCPRQHIIVIGHDKISWKFFSKMQKIHNRRLTIVDWR